VLKTAAEIAKLKGVSRQAANEFIQKNAIPPAGKKGKLTTFDCDQEPLASYLSGAAKPAKALPPARLAMPTVTESAAVPMPIRSLFEDIQEGSSPAAFFYKQAIEIAQANKDGALLAKMAEKAAEEERREILYRQTLKTEQAKEQIAIGQSERIQLENEIRRDGYMAKPTVKLIFGKQYAVDTSTLMPLGLKLADMIDALPPGPDRKGKIQKLIDNEVFSALESKRRILAEYIGDVGESA